MRDVYGWKNKINGKWYIGITKRGYKVRWKEHSKQPFYNGEKSEVLKKFYSAIRKYGVDNFEKVILEEHDENYDLIELAGRERYWIAYYNSHYNGYNCDDGGNGFGYEIPEDVKIKMSQNRKGKLCGDNNPMRDPEIAKKNADARRGKKLSEEAVANIKAAHPKGFGAGEDNPMWGKRGENNPNFGRHWNENEKSKHNLKAVIGLHIKTQQEFYFESRAEAERITGVKA